VTIGLYMRAVAESTVANVKFTNFTLEGALLLAITSLE